MIEGTWLVERRRDGRKPNKKNFWRANRKKKAEIQGRPEESEKAERRKDDRRSSLRNKNRIIIDKIIQRKKKQVKRLVKAVSEWLTKKKEAGI